jgi:hypothetical protein
MLFRPGESILHSQQFIPIVLIVRILELILHILPPERHSWHRPHL